MSFNDQQVSGLPQHEQCYQNWQIFCQKMLESIQPYFGLSKLLTTRNTHSNFGGFKKTNIVTRSVQLTAVVVVFKVAFLISVIS